MEISYRVGQTVTILAMAMLVVGSLANPLLLPINVVGAYGCWRALRVWSAQDDDAPLWGGTAVICGLLLTGFSLLSGAITWVLWTLTTLLLLVIGWLGARDHAGRLRRNWALRRNMTIDPGAQHPQRHAPGPKTDC